MKGLSLVLMGTLFFAGCASFTATDSGHRFRGTTAHPAKVMRAAGEAEVNSAVGYAIRSQADDISLAVERRDVLPVPSYGYGYGGLNTFDSEFYGVGGVAHPGYATTGQAMSSAGAGDSETRRLAEENRRVLQGLERVMRGEAVEGGE